MLYLLEGFSIALLIILIGLFAKHMGLCVNLSKTRKKHIDEVSKLKEEVAHLQDLVKSYQRNEDFLLKELQKIQEGEYKSMD